MKMEKISFYTEDTNADFCKLIIEDSGIRMKESTINELLSDSVLLAKKDKSEIIAILMTIQNRK